MNEIIIKQGHPDAARDVDGGQTTPRLPTRSRVGTVTAGTADAAAHRWLLRHSITLLRISMGAVILTFGILKYVPGMSPAEDLVRATTKLLTFGLVPAGVAIVAVATLECGIGLSLLTGRLMRVSVYLQAIWLIGILSPVVLLPGRLFSGPYHAPTLEGQYVLKDLILLTAARPSHSLGHRHATAGVAQPIGLCQPVPHRGGGSRSRWPCWLAGGPAGRGGPMAVLSAGAGFTWSCAVVLPDG